MKLLNIHERNLPGDEKRFLDKKVLVGLRQEKSLRPTGEQRKRHRLRRS